MSGVTALAGSWTSLPTPLTPWILDVIQSMGHNQMTPVQASTIPLFMKHKDVVVEAVTGSGKTLAFVIPILERLVRLDRKLRKHEIGALVITPTRELATQIHSIFSLFLASQPNVMPQSNSDPSSQRVGSEHPQPLILVSSAQSSPAQDVQRFIATGADIIIGTPGRVEEFLLGKGKNTVSVKELEILVLDEADRLLDLGFQTTLTRILTCLPKQRRTGLFSATMTDVNALSELVRVGLRNPARIVVKVQSKKVRPRSPSDAGKTRTGEVVEERRIPANLQNFYLTCSSSEKLVQLTRIIAHEVSVHQSSRFIVYFATCACVDYFFRILPSVIPSSTTLYSLHGHLPPTARTRTLSTFSSVLSSPSSPSILLATDVAARGLDLPHVDVVVQFDPPADPKAFSHRCGRTARAGRSGRAWVLLVGKETEYIDFMSIRKIPLKERSYLIDHTSAQSSQTDTNSRPEDSHVYSFLDKIRKKLLTDRGLHDQAAKAFVSFVRAYSKHEASYIFRIKDLDLVGVAKSFGLLRLPRMPEFKDVNCDDKWQDAIVDWTTYAYADQAREAKRLAAGVIPTTALDDEREVRRAERAKKKQLNSAWSEKVSKKEAREKRKDKKSRKKIWLKAQQSSVAAGSDISSKLGLKRSRTDEVECSGDDGEDWAELAREEKMAKKVRKGEVTQDMFDKEFCS